MSSRIPAISGISMDTAKAKFGNLAYTNYYELFIKPSWGGVDSKTRKPPFLQFIEKNKDRLLY